MAPAVPRSTTCRCSARVGARTVDSRPPVSEGAGLLLLLVGLGGLGATGALAACCLRLRSPIEYLLASYLLAWLVALAFALSPGRWLTRGTLLAGIAVGLGIVLVAWARLGRPHAPGLGPALVRCRDALDAPTVAILVACLAVAAVYIVALAFFTPSNDQDALEYHLARAALWKQQHGLGHVDGADDARLNLFPPNAEIGQLATMLLAGRDRYAALPQLLAYVALVLSVAGLARRASFGVKEAAFSAAAFATLPIVVVQAPSAMNDLVVGSFLTAAAYFGLATRRATTIPLAVGVALAVGTKLTAFVALPTLALVFAVGHPRRRWPLLLVAIAGGCLAGSVWFAVNLVETGGLGTDVPNQPNQSADLEPTVLAVTSLRLALSVLDMSGAPGPYALVFIAAAIGLATAALVQFRRSRGGGALLLAGALAAAVVAIPRGVGRRRSRRVQARALRRRALPHRPLRLEAQHESRAVGRRVRPARARRARRRHDRGGDAVASRPATRARRRAVRGASDRPRDARSRGLVGPDDWIHPFFGPTLRRHVELVSPRRGTPSRGVQWLVLGPNAAVVRCGGSWEAVFANEAGWRVERRVAPDRCPSPSD